MKKHCADAIYAIELIDDRLELTSGLDASVPAVDLLADFLHDLDIEV